jgi:hypothetical protein
VVLPRHLITAAALEPRFLRPVAVAPRTSEVGGPLSDLMPTRLTIMFRASRNSLVVVRVFAYHTALAETSARLDLHHGMEEVIGSNPIRSTKTFQRLSPPQPATYLARESNWSPNPFVRWAVMAP